MTIARDDLGRERHSLPLNQRRSAVPLCSAVSSSPEASRRARWWPATDAERLRVHGLGNGVELSRGYHEGGPQLYLRHGEPGRRFEDEERRRPDNPGLWLTSWARGVIRIGLSPPALLGEVKRRISQRHKALAYRLGEHGAFLKASL